MLSNMNGIYYEKSKAKRTSNVKIFRITKAITETRGTRTDADANSAYKRKEIRRQQRLTWHCWPSENTNDIVFEPTATTSARTKGRPLASRRRVPTLFCDRALSLQMMSSKKNDYEKVIIQLHYASHYHSR